MPLLKLETLAETEAFSAFLLNSASTTTARGMLDALSHALPMLVPITVRASVVLPEGEGLLRIVALDGSTAIPLDKCVPIHGTQVGKAFLTGEVQVTETIRADSPYLELPMLHAQGLRSCISVPLKKGDRVLGVMNLGCKQSHRWQSERMRLEQIAQIAATQLWLHARIQEAEEGLANNQGFARTLSTITELGCSLSLARDEPTLLDLIQSTVPGLLPSRRMSLVLVEPDGITLYGRVLHGPLALRPPLPFNVNAQANLTRCLASGKVEVLHDTRGSTLTDAMWALSVGLHTVLCSPLSAGGTPLGTLNFGRDQAHSFSPQDIAVARQLGATIATAIVALRGRQRLNEARARAEEIAELKGRFLAVMAHELRTPLHAVIGMSELLLGDGLSERQRKMIKTISASGKILSALIDNVLDFSKLDSNEMLISTEPFQVKALAQETVAMLTDHAASRSVRLQVTAALPEPILVADPNRFRQVLLNLTSNAIKFTENGTVHIHLSPWPEHGIQISVRDTGIGIPAQALEHIFEPYQQADSSTTRRFGGTGLGLAICRQLCEAMGGWIQVESQPGVGSTFTFVVAGELQPDTTSLPSASEEGPSLPLRILLVDDHAVNRLVGRSQLERLGYRPMVASSGEEARQCYREAAYDLVLIDVHMPDENGPEVTQSLLSAPGPHAVFIALTADILPETQALCRASGMAAVLSKPLHLKQLSSVLRAVTPQQGTRSAVLVEALPTPATPSPMT